MFAKILPFLLLLSATAAFGQDAITCQSFSSPATVRKEGLSEALGSITLDCKGGAPGARVSGTLTLFLNRPIANRVVNDTVPDALLQMTSGGSTTTLNTTVTRNGTGGVSFGGFSFDIPASRQFTLQISRLRAEVAGSDQPITATLGLNGLNNLALNGNFLVVGQPLTGLYSSFSFANIQDVTKTLPSTFAEAVQSELPSFTTRVTEGFSTAFQTKQDGADTGIRVMIRYSTVPAGLRLAVPDLISGSSSTEPTSTGGFGGTVQAGKQTPGALTLARVLQPASDGSNGILVTFNQGGAFGTLREVPLVNGAGVAVYEVVDGNPFLTESAQIPTFLEMKILASGTIRTRTSFAPLRAAGTPGSAVPSFIDAEPATDCQTARDCEAGPRLSVNADPLVVTGMEATGFQIRYVRINNAGSGGFLWSAKIAYTNGADWLRIDRTEGTSSATIRLDFLPDKVPGPGVYNATLTIDAGSAAGSRVLPVQFVVTANPVLRGPLVNSGVHAATGLEGIVPGGQGLLRGVRFDGQSAEVKIGGVTARIITRSSEQILFEVPFALFGRDRADVVVTVDGTASLPSTVKLSPVMPAVFAGGVTNAGGNVNSPAQPAAPNSTVALRVTGIPTHALETITFRFAGREELARPTSVAPATPGSQILELQLPEGLVGPATDLQVCAADFCGPAVKLLVAP